MDFDEDDLLSLAIESVEKESDGVSSTENCPQSYHNAKIGSSESAPISGSNCTEGNSFFEEDDDDILAQAFKSIEESKNITKVQKKRSSLIGVDLKFEDNSPDEPVKELVSKQKFEKSVVHSGDTDSSDDEDNKYFEESRYDTYGKTLKKALKENENRPTLVNKSEASSWKGRAHAKNNFLAPEKIVPSKQTNEASYDPVFGIKIVNPLVSSYTIKEKMAGRTPINFMKLKSHVVNGDLKSDWVIAAVIVRKFPPKVSQNGSNYSNWIISDLKGSLKTASLFLFGRAHEDLWKTPSGTVIAILNPFVLNDKKQTDFEAKLSVKSSDQVMIWGRSKDLGQCNFRKKNGEICGTFVNVSECEFCVYHVQQEYKKFNSRAELQTNGKPKVNLRNKVLGKNEVFYGGKSFTAMPFMGKKAHNPKDKERLNGLGMPKCDLKTPPEKMSIPVLQRSNKMFNMLPSGNTLLPSNAADEKRLSALFEKKSTSVTEAKEKSTPIIKEKEKSVPSTKEKSVPSTKEKNLPSTKEKRISSTKEKSPLVTETKDKNPPKEKPKVLNTLSQEKKPLLSNPGNEIAFDLEICSPKITPPINRVVKENSKRNHRITEKNRLQKRFSSLVSMTSDSTIAAKTTPYVPTEHSKDKNHQVINTVSSKPVLTQSPKTGNSKKPPPSPNVVQTENLPKQKDDNVKHRQIGVSPADEVLNSQASEETTDIIKSKEGIVPLQRQKPNPKTPPNAGMSKAKLRALQFIKNKGPISKENPKGTEESKKGIKRPLSPTPEENNDKKPVLSERFLQLMNQKSIHEDLVEAREIEQEFEYFDRMEKKDRLEEKMLNTFKVDCKAVRCLKCNYIWFSASDACKAEGHPIKVVDAVKRFFKCGKCSNRTISLTLIPLIPCKKCFSSNWVRAPMIREKLVKNDTLSIRGGEQKFVNGSITNGSLDLLVPD